jgi:hypothetical protein
MKLYSVYVFVCLCGNEMESAESECECPRCGRKVELNWGCEPDGDRQASSRRWTPAPISTRRENQFAYLEVCHEV